MMPWRRCATPSFDLDHTRITAPFTGRIGTHLVSVGNLIAGSRAAPAPPPCSPRSSRSIPIYLNFDMSEADYMTFLRQRQKQGGGADKVQISLGRRHRLTHDGTLDFIDNALDRSSGTIHARATVAERRSALTPGGFARVRCRSPKPTPVLLVPDAAVLPDQSDHIVLTVGSTTSSPKAGPDRRSARRLRVIRSGLAPTDRVIIDGIPIAHPGAKVAPHDRQIRFAMTRSSATINRLRTDP